MSGTGSAFHELQRIFAKCSVHLERIAGSSVEKNLLKGLGKTGKAVGKFIGGIPVVNKGPVDEFLQESGAKLVGSAEKMESGIIRSFAEISDPQIHVFIRKLDDMVKIYNHTTEICFDDKQIYLVAG